MTKRGVNTAKQKHFLRNVSKFIKELKLYKEQEGIDGFNHIDEQHVFDLPDDDDDYFTEIRIIVKRIGKPFVKRVKGIRNLDDFKIFLTGLGLTEIAYINEGLYDFRAIVDHEKHTIDPKNFTIVDNPYKLKSWTVVKLDKKEIDNEN